MINAILSEAIWGDVETPAPGDALAIDHWKMISDVPTSVRPKEGAVTYGYFLENMVLNDLAVICTE
jgi:hypothetical protein